MDAYQAIVIGSGQGGTPLAGALAAAGWRALIERTHIGGTCINEGCTPTKTMVASARVAYLARRAADYGVHTGDIRIDMQRVRQRKGDIVMSFRSGSQKRLEKTANLELIFGESGAQLLAGEDLDVATDVAAILKQDGIEILLNAKAQRATKSSAGVELTVRSGAETRALSRSHMLVATGRVPNTDTLNVAAAGIGTDAKGFIRADSKLETNVEGVYAHGDIKGGPAFTHVSYDDFRILRTNLIEKGSASTEGRLVPYTVFIDPRLGRVGLTETQARAQNKKIRVAKMPMKSVERALEADETSGFLKAVVDADTNQNLGAAVLGIEGGEIAAILQIAMMGRLPFAALRDGVFAHPNLAESLNNLFTHLDAN